MRRGNRQHETHSQLLEAAVRVIERAGLQGFTLDAVALEAGVSKGGLFYHFDSKQDLIRGMVEVAMQAFESRVEELMDGSPGGYVRAFVTATVEAATSPRHLRTTTALAAAMAAEPQLLVPYARRSRQWQSRLEQDGIPPARATLARLGADGLFYANLFGAGEVFAGQREQVIRLLLELAGEEKNGSAPDPPLRAHDVVPETTS